jgi:hypothetical protein
MGFGKSIRFYLPSGSINGIRHAEIVNWTGQAMSCPRSQFKELKSWQETSKPGIYFLFGVEQDGPQFSAYIGEAENVYERVKDHIAEKVFWNEMVCFTSKDENLTKAHVKYLESLIIEQANKIGRYEIDNTVSPSQPSLPVSDRDAMKEFAQNIRTLLGALGHKLLEPYILKDSESSYTNIEENILKLANKDAYGVLVSDGFLILKGSWMSKNINKSMPKNAQLSHQSLLTNKVVQEELDGYYFSEDWLASSPSHAACIVTGSSKNGLDVWKNNEGKSLKELELENS